MKYHKYFFTNPSRHGCISQMHLWDVSYRVSKKSQRRLICKSPRRLPGDWLKTSSWRILRYLSGFLRDVFELNLRLILGLQTKALFSFLFINLPISIFFAKLNWYRKLLRTWFKLGIYLRYFYKRINFSDQMGRLRFP